MFAENGFEEITGFACAQELSQLREAVGLLPYSGRSGGVRNIEKKSDVIRLFAMSEKVINLVSAQIGQNPTLARGIFFNKMPTQNWLVPWHQDKTTSVSEKIDCNDWQNWTVKDGISHAQPPHYVFKKMLTLRLHLDPASKENGGLQVIPKSHLSGVLPQTDILDYCDRTQPYLCEAMAGDALIMHPLLIHRSCKATAPSLRRIIHLEYSCFELPDSVKWV